MTKELSAQEKELSDLNEAIFIYEWFRDEALERGDEEEVKFLNAQIQGCKRQKVCIKKGTTYEIHSSEALYFAMMGA